MRFIFVFLLLCSPLLAREFNLEFTAEEWAAIGDPEEFEDDLVVLNDGTKLWGKVSHVPSLHYPWGRVDFRQEEVAGISFANLMQVVTRNGQNFIGRLPASPLLFEQRHTEPSEERRVLWFFRKQFTPVSYHERKISCEQINFVLFKRREAQKLLIDDRFHSVELTSGDRFPVILDGTPINLSDGWKDYKIQPAQILDVQFEGGIHGWVKGSPLDRKVEFSIVKDQFLPVRLAKNGQRLKIPWDQIARIRGDMGRFIVTTPYHFSERAPEGMVFIPPGRFLLSANDPMIKTVKMQERRGLAARLANRMGSGTAVARGRLPLIDPTYVVEMEGFYMDRHEVTNREYWHFVRATGHRAPPHWPEGKVPQGLDDHPVVNVSQTDAASYAQWAGKRLPTELEWERAARGGDEELSEDFVRYRIDDEATAPVGAARQSNLALWDMMGNVAEWTASAFERDETQKKGYYAPRSKIRSSAYKAVRGGGFSHSAHTATPMHRTPMHASDYNAWTGFRCVSDVAPEYR